MRDSGKVFIAFYGDFPCSDELLLDVFRRTPYFIEFYNSGDEIVASQGFLGANILP